MPSASAHLVVVAGDILDQTTVDEVMRGADVVVRVFCQAMGSPPTEQTDGTRHIVTAMRHEGVRRIISLSGGGLPSEEHDRPKTPHRIVRFWFQVLAPKVLAVAKGHIEVLKTSGLDWTVARGPRLTDEAGSGTYRVGWVGVNASTQIAREDLARFILSQVDDRKFINQLPFVSR